MHDLNYLHSPLFSFFKKLGFSYRFSSKWEVMSGKKKHISQIQIIQALYFMNYSIPFTKQYAFVNQYGPGIVVLEFKLSIGKASAIQTVTPIEPIYQILVHTMYMPWYIPKILCKIAFTNAENNDLFCTIIDLLTACCCFVGQWQISMLCELLQILPKVQKALATLLLSPS